MTLNLVGQTFGELKVIAKAERIYVQTSKIWRTQWKCVCLCTKTTLKTTDALRSRRVRSCGCCEWHIHHKDAYISWSAMKQRCDDINHKDYPYYGGAGRSYDPRWSKFVEFYKDMGDPPYDLRTKERYSLDRKDNDGNYSKENCKWSDRSDQQGNRF